MSRRTRRRLAALAAAAITLVLAYLMARPSAIAVEVAAVTIGPLTQTVGDEGRTRVLDRHVVTAPVAGRLERIGVEAGDRVSRGQVIARLAPLPLDARGRAQAEASLQAALDHERTAMAGVGLARTALDQARRDLERAERLFAGQLIAPADLERLQLVEQSRVRELEAAEFQASAAAHEVQVARAALGPAAPARRAAWLELRAPADGLVLTVPERSARTVAPGEPLLELGDPGHIEIVVDLLSSDAVRVSPGDRMLVTGWGGDDVIEGRVRLVEPSGFTRVSALGVEEQRVNVVGELTSPVRGLGDRFRVEVRIVLWQADSVLKVPASALFRRGDDWAVFTIEAGRARERRVTTGHHSPAEVEVVEGLGAGEVVVRHPMDSVRDGVRVRYPR